MTRNELSQHGLRRRAGSGQRGFTMIESLVALVVLAIGLLGIAALYLDSLRASRTAVYRSEAVNLAADFADRLRANNQGDLSYASAFGDAHAVVAACDTTAGCTPAELAETDLARWKATLAQLLPGGAGEVQVTAPALAGDPASYVITVRWTEVGQAAALQYQLRIET